MEGLTKKSAKVRLIISFVLAMIFTVVLGVIQLLSKHLEIILIVVPVLMTWSFSSVLFWPKKYFSEVVVSAWKMLLHLFTFRFGDAINDLFRQISWCFTSLVKSIRVIFWMLSSKE